MANNSEAYIGFNCPLELRKLLEKWSVEDDRSMANILRRLIVQENERRQEDRKRKKIVEIPE